MELKFKCYHVLKEEQRKMFPHEVAQKLFIKKYLEIDRILLSLSKNFKNIHVEYDSLKQCNKFWWEPTKA